MNDYNLSPETMSHLDLVCSLAERNGWNAAINACRQLLPAEYSIRLRGLYKLDEPFALPQADQEKRD